MPDPQHPNHSAPQSQTPEELQAEAEAQVDLAVHSAATDPQPLLDEENDPILKDVKQSSDQSQ
jgi:hypothetical protein